MITSSGARKKFSSVIIEKWNSAEEVKSFFPCDPPDVVLHKKSRVIFDWVGTWTDTNEGGPEATRDATLKYLELCCKIFFPDQDYVGKGRGELTTFRVGAYRSAITKRERKSPALCKREIFNVYNRRKKTQWIKSTLVSCMVLNHTARCCRTRIKHVRALQKLAQFY